MRWLKDGGANTKLFHAVANGRHVKNFIPAIRHAGELITDQQRKEAVFFDSYNELLGRIQNREHTINLDMLDIQEHDLQDLGALFTKEEVWEIIKEMPSDKAPGPNGFIGAFYKRAWPTIKLEIMAAVTKLYVGDGRAFGGLNCALITLVPQKQGAEEVGDFRPISLVHSFAKLFSKLIANRLRPQMESRVSANQSAFIKERNLHDNFLLVRQLARKINQRKEPGVQLKLDLARAFNSLSWAFLFEVLEKLGFPASVRQWIAIALRTASTKITVNGVPGRKISHARGLRQGDPLSPLLFVLTMEVTTALLKKVVDLGVLSPIGNCTAAQRISIYADDVVIFVKPTVQDLVAVRELLALFGEASGLQVNYRKTFGDTHQSWGVRRGTGCCSPTVCCHALPNQVLGPAARPAPAHQSEVAADARCNCPHCTCLATRNDRPAGKTDSAQISPCGASGHHLLVPEAPCWLFDEVDKWFRGFFWNAKDRASGGQCLVAWNQVCKEFEHGGLGVKNLRLQGLALRVRWEWLRRTDPDRPWQGLPPFSDAQAREVFDKLVKIQNGDGRQVLF
jgi:hypothetical protein